MHIVGRKQSNGGDLPSESMCERVCVIGAGPSGLVALKTLLENSYECVCLEKDDTIGGTFVNKAYDSGRLVSSKYITAFSDFRISERFGLLIVVAVVFL